MSSLVLTYLGPYFECKFDTVVNEVPSCEHNPPPQEVYCSKCGEKNYMQKVEDIVQKFSMKELYGLGIIDLRTNKKEKLIYFGISRHVRPQFYHTTMYDGVVVSLPRAEQQTLDMGQLITNGRYAWLSAKYGRDNVNVRWGLIVDWRQ